MNKHIYFYYVLKIFTGIMSLATIVFFINYGGQSNYGQYALIVSIIFALNNTFSGWISQVILKFYIIKKSNYFLKKFILFSGVVSLLLGVLVLMGYSYFNHMSNIFVLSILFIALFLFSIYSSFLQKNYKFKFITLLEITRTLTLFSIPFLAITIFSIKLTVSLLLIAITLSYIFPLFFIQIVNINKSKEHIQNFIKIINIKVNKKLIKIYLSYGLPIGLWLGISTMLNVSDRYIISYYYSYTEVGIYSSIYDITYKICTFALAPVLTAIHPLIMNEYNNKSQKFHLIILKALKLEIRILPLLVITIGILSIFSDILVNVPFKQFLSISIPILLGAFIWNFSMILHKPLEIKNKTLKMLYFITIALCVNIIGNLIFIPIFGYITAAYTTIISFLIYILLISHHLRVNNK